MNNYQQAILMLEGLPNGWDWSIGKHDDWYYCIIRKAGWKDEPEYCSSDDGLPASHTLFECVERALATYHKGEKGGVAA